MPNAYSMVACKIALRGDGYEYETRTGYFLTRSERRQALGSCARRGAVKIGGYHAVEALLKDVEQVLRSVLE